jgi:hypothetical protein
MNEQLQLLEEQLESLELSKRIGLYLVVFIAIVYSSWNFFGEDLSNEIATKEDAIASLEQKLQKNNIKSLERVLKKTKTSILTLQDDIVALRFKEQFIINKLESLDFVYFNDMGIAEILDGILKKSLKYHIDINLIEYEAKDVSYVPHIKEREDIVILANASFKSIMQLVNYIDSINALLQIREISVGISDDDITNFKIKISHYGVEI